MTNDWSREYASGQWDCLNNVRKVAHYAVTAAFIGYFGTTRRILDVACGEGILQRYLRLWIYQRYSGIR